MPLNSVLSRAASTRIRTIRRTCTTSRRRSQLLAEAGLEGPRRAGTAREERPAAGARTALQQQEQRELDDRLPGGSAQGRHRPQPAARDAGNAVQARHGPQLQHGRDGLGRAALPESRDVLRVGTRRSDRTTTTSPASRMRRSTRSCKQYDTEYDQKKRAALIQEVDGIIANSYQYMLRWDAPFQRIAYWNKFGHAGGLSHAHRRLPDMPEPLVGRSRRRTPNCERAMGDNVGEAAGRRDRSPLLAAVRRAREGRGRRRNDRVLHPALPADHPDVHRDHAGRLRRDAVRARRPGRTADHALPDGRHGRAAAAPRR